MKQLILIFLATAIVNNFVLYYFLGICPFLGVSKKLDSAWGLSFATTFVMALTAPVSWLINKYILVQFDAAYLTYVAFIIVIASLVQFVEMYVRKISPSLYQSLGIFLPLITTNCAVLGLALFQLLKDFTFVESIVYGIGAGVGFSLALVILAGIREELEFSDVPAAFKGVPIALITAGLLALGFLGFSGLISI